MKWIDKIVALLTRLFRWLSEAARRVWNKIVSSVRRWLKSNRGWIKGKLRRGFIVVLKASGRKAALHVLKKKGIDLDKRYDVAKAVRQAVDKRASRVHRVELSRKANQIRKDKLPDRELTYQITAEAL